MNKRKKRIYSVILILAGLALLVISLYLYERGRNAWVTAVPMVFMLVSTLLAMVGNLRRFWSQWQEGGSVLFVVGAGLLVLAVWLTIEAILRFRVVRRRPRQTSMSIELDEGGAP